MLDNTLALIAAGKADVPPGHVNQCAVNELLKRGEVEQGDWVIISKGDFNKVHGGTSTMKLVKVAAALGFFEKRNI